MKSAHIALLGRPSAGKSSILNALCGHKIAIVAPSPQTTRNTVRGILNEDRGQLVFLDTPGFHISKKKLNRHLRRLAESTIQECDLLLYVIDISRNFGEEEEALIRLAAEADSAGGDYSKEDAVSGAAGSPAAGKLIVALNKTDLGTKRLDFFGGLLAEKLPRAAVYPVSAKTGFGMTDLKTGLFLRAPEGEAMYPEHYYTDQDPEFRISEIIREQVVKRMRQELPHAVYVEVQDSKLSEDGEKMWLWVFIFVERESQKGMIVGKGGNLIKQIRLASEKELAALFPYRIELDLRVKTAPHWHKDEILLRRLIH
jgi:GTPase